MSAAGAESATVSYRARFDECGPDGALRPSSFLRWAQDVAWVHSERLGFGRDWYSERGLAWLVRAVDLAILVAVPTGFEVAVTTRVVGWRHVMARRRTDFVAASGGRVAFAFTDWVMTDDAGAPTRIPEVFPARFAAPAGSFTPTRVTPGTPPPHATVRRDVVRPHDLDPMGHVNNAVYLDYVQDAIGLPTIGGEVPFPPRYRLEYLLAASSSDELIARVWRDEADLLYVLSRGPGMADSSADETTLLRASIGPAAVERSPVRA